MSKPPSPAMRRAQPTTRKPHDKRVTQAIRAMTALGERVARLSGERRIAGQRMHLSRNHLSRVSAVATSPLDAARDFSLAETARHRARVRPRSLLRGGKL